MYERVWVHLRAFARVHEVQCSAVQIGMPRPQPGLGAMSHPVFAIQMDARSQYSCPHSMLWMRAVTAKYN